MTKIAAFSASMTTCAPGCFAQVSMKTELTSKQEGAPVSRARTVEVAHKRGDRKDMNHGKAQAERMKQSDAKQTSIKRQRTGSEIRLSTKIHSRNLKREAERSPSGTSNSARHDIVWINQAIGGATRTAVEPAATGQKGEKCYSRRLFGFLNWAKHGEREAKMDTSQASRWQDQTQYIPLTCFALADLTWNELSRFEDNIRWQVYQSRLLEVLSLCWQRYYGEAAHEG